MTQRNRVAPYEVTTMDRVVGLVVLVMIGLVAYGLVLHYQRLGMGETELRYHAITAQANGIAKGGDVRLSGISIGSIDTISLQPDGRVRVEIVVGTEYQAFVTKGSRLEVDSTIGLGSIISGSGLRLIPGPRGAPQLERGARIELNVPTNLADIVDPEELRRVAVDVKTIIANLREISGTVVDSQQRITTTLDSARATVAELRAAIATLPRMIGTVEQGFNTWRQAGQRIESVAGEVEKLLRDIRPGATASVNNARVASERLKGALQTLNKAIQDARGLIQELHKSAKQMPLLMADGRQLLDSANSLTDNLNRHWLFGNRETQAVPPYLPGAHPDDPTLYEPDTSR